MSTEILCSERETGCASWMLCDKSDKTLLPFEHAIARRSITQITHADHRRASTGGQVHKAQRPCTQSQTQSSEPRAQSQQITRRKARRSPFVPPPPHTLACIPSLACSHHTIVHLFNKRTQKLED